jgi:2-keto-4-pentenoate hydratase
MQEAPLARSISAVADRLELAARQRVPCEPVRDAVPTLGAAYAVQRELGRRRLLAGAEVTGHKVGLTSPAVQRQLGVDQPDFGLLFDDMDVSGGLAVPVDRLLQPKVEAEIAFVLRHDLEDADADDSEVRDAVAYAVAALEIVDSRIAGWDITITDTVADNASSGLYVLSGSRFSLADLEPREVRMRMWVDDELVSTGSGADCLGDPLTALAWVARTAREHGNPLRAGQVVLSGALGPMAPVGAGSVVRAELSGLGEVGVEFR